MSKAQAGDTLRGCRGRERQRLREELHIGMRLRQIRGLHQLTQGQVADRLALNRTAYTHYENGVNLPDILTLVRLAGVYGMPPEDLVAFLVGHGGEAPPG